MNVSLTPELTNLVNAKVASGHYHTASEVVREGLRLLQERDEIRERKLAALKADLQVGLDALESGDYRDGRVVMAELTERLLEMKQRNG